MAARGGNPLRGMLNEGPARKRSRFALIGEVYVELTRVTWPNRQDAARLTLLVLLVAAFMGLFLGIFWDQVFSFAVEKFFLDSPQT